MTIPRFDIFRRDRIGGLLWIGTAADISEARNRIAQHPSRSQEFLLLDMRTGAKIPLKVQPRETIESLLGRSAMHVRA
jgi:hypothetical protein